MKNIMIKAFVVVIGLLAYASVSQYFTIQRMNDKNEQLNNNIVDLEELIDGLSDQIDNLQDQLENGETPSPDDNVVEDTCNKLYEITIQVIIENEDFDQSYVHCTNKSTLGDALDEVLDELQIVYDPNFSKDYIYGRLVHSFYGFGKEYEEFYEITVNGVRADYGVDFITLEDGNSYEFTLVRWA